MLHTRWRVAVELEPHGSWRDRARRIGKHLGRPDERGYDPGIRPIGEHAAHHQHGF